MDLIKLKITGGGDMTRHKEMLEDKELIRSMSEKLGFTPEILNVLG